jgi:hypothetical protein
MGKGKAITDTVGRPGQVSYETAGQWDFLYTTSTEKNPKYDIGDKMVLPDGRVFRYAKSGGACWTGRGVTFENAIPATGIDYSLLAAAAVIGDRSVVMTNQGTVAQTKDGLKGGTILFKLLTGSDDSALQQRGIIGNTAGGVSDEITIYLDAGLTAAVSTASYAFCMPSPYSNLKYDASSQSKSYAGVPAVYVSASDMYFWVQTWGSLWIAPQNEVGKSTKQRDVVFKEDGSLQHKGTTDATYLNGQRAGFIVDNNAANNGSTVICLQINP